MKTYKASGITLEFPDSLFDLLDRDAARRRELGRQALEARLLAAGMQPAQGSVSASSSPGAQRGASNVGSAAGSPAMGDREQN